MVLFLSGLTRAAKSLQDLLGETGVASQHFICLEIPVHHHQAVAGSRQDPAVGKAGRIKLSLFPGSITALCHRSIHPGARFRDWDHRQLSHPGRSIHCSSVLQLSSFVLFLTFFPSPAQVLTGLVHVHDFSIQEILMAAHPMIPGHRGLANTVLRTKLPTLPWWECHTVPGQWDRLVLHPTAGCVSCPGCHSPTGGAAGASR